MTYSNTFPVGYQPYYPQYQQMSNQVNNQQNVQQNTQNNQVQNGGFVRVQNENEARNYLVAQGTSVTFRDESAPYIYTKTMGFSPLDAPVFEKFKLVKEDEPIAPEKPKEYVLKKDFENLKNEFEKFKKEMRIIDEPV